MRTGSIFTVILSLFASGCSSISPLNFTPNTIPTNSAKLDAALLSTNVTIASKAEAKGKIDTAGVEADVASLWKSALDDALVRMSLFRDDSPRKTSLVVTVLELNTKGLGFGTRTVARYELIDRKTGTAIFKTDISTEGRAKDYTGADRVRKSASRSVQANIEQFLLQIAAAKLPE